MQAIFLLPKTSLLNPYDADSESSDNQENEPSTAPYQATTSQQQKTHKTTSVKENKFKVDH